METTKREIISPYGFIYITTNLINGMRYLGQKKFCKGWKQYLGSGTVIKQAIQKYGKENFHRTIIHICYSEDELNKAEYDLSIILNVVESDGWYNLVYGGGTSCGWHMSEETKEKIRQKRIGVTLSEETRHLLSRKLSGEKNPWYGRKHTDEELEKMSANRKGKCAGENNYWYGKHLSEETKLKISKSKTGKTASEETRRKLSEAHLGSKNKGAKSVLQFSQDGIILKEWNCIMDIKRELGIDNSSVVKCCKGKLKSAGGFIWRYKENETSTEN